MKLFDGPEKYVIDTSSLITGMKVLYPIGIFPSLWDKIAEKINFGEVVAPDEVRLEVLERGDDEVALWSKQFSNFFYPEDEELQLAVVDLLRDQNHQKLLGSNRTTKHCADVWVVALAKIKRLTVVTQETFVQVQNGTKKYKIPNVCDDLEIRCIDLLKFIEEQSWSF